MSWPAGPFGPASGPGQATGPRPAVGSVLPPLLDLTVLIAALTLIGSLFMTWYQFGMNLPIATGSYYGITSTALGNLAGGWRFAILGFAIATAAEVIVGTVLARVQQTVVWPHRNLLAMLCLANLVLVLAAFFVYPSTFGLSGETFYGIIGSSRGGGAYLGLVAALVACGAAAVRLFTEPSTFRR